MKIMRIKRFTYGEDLTVVARTQEEGLTALRTECNRRSIRDFGKELTDNDWANILRGITVI